MLGVDYNTILANDLRFYQSLITGFMRKREYTINDSLQVGHTIASKIAQAVWGDKNFTRPVDYVKVVPPTADEKRAQQLAQIEFLLKGELI